MFTGIIEKIGTIKQVISSGSNISFWIQSPLSDEFKVDQSVSHNGVCLTVEAIKGNQHRITAIEETLDKTNLRSWSEGDIINLERCLAFNGRLDGHFVQGHIDGTGTCINRIDKNGSWEFEISFEDEFAALVIEKGSIALNGISLTVFNVKRNSFSVAIIPYTFEHTNMQQIQKGTVVNLEFDVIGKYLMRKLSLESLMTSDS